MNNPLKSKFYIAACILWMVWLVGFFFFNIGPMVHILAGLAILFYLEAIFITPKPKQERNV